MSHLARGPLGIDGKANAVGRRHDELYARTAAKEAPA